MTSPCMAVSEDDLLDYWTHTIDEGNAELIEEHLFSCSACTERLEALAALGASLTQLVRRGRISGIVSRSLLNRMQRDGLHLRQYALSPGESVQCAAFPDDDLLILSLRADFAGSDTITISLIGPDQAVIDRVSDVAVSPTDFEILWATPAEIVRQQPSTRLRLMIASEPRGAVLAEYELDHTALPPG